MTEIPKVNRQDLPRIKNNPDVARVLNVAREKVDGKLPPLMEDTRTNFLARVVGNTEDIYVKAVASPWVGQHGIHFMVIPDSKDHRNIPGISDLNSKGLGDSLQLAESLAYHTLQQDGISEVDFGINHSRGELKRGRKSILASIPLNLHIHITGYNPRDLEPLTADDITKSSEITGRTGEALYTLGEEIIYGEIFPQLRESFPTFNAIFGEVKDMRGRKRLKMVQGRESFSHPDFPIILQAMDKLAKQKYDELAKCFFEYDETSGQFVTNQNQDERYKLLDRETRIAKIKDYIGDHALSSGVKLGLLMLAGIAKDEQTVMDRELNILAQRKGGDLTEEETEAQAANIANRFWAYKDLAYALVWSAKKAENGEVEWIVGFDPKVFTIHGPHQSSAYTNKLVERDIKGYFTHDQLEAAKRREKEVLSEVKEEMKSLEITV